MGSACARFARRRNLRLHCADGAAWVAGPAARVRKRAEPPLDLVLLDAFDGADAVPACFTQPGAPQRAGSRPGLALTRLLTMLVVVGACLHQAAHRVCCKMMCTPASSGRLQMRQQCCGPASFGQVGGHVLGVYLGQWFGFRACLCSQCKSLAVCKRGVAPESMGGHRMPCCCAACCAVHGSTCFGHAGSALSMPCGHKCSVSAQQRVPYLCACPHPGCAAHAGGAFLRDLAAALHPVTGALVANLHRADASCPPDVPGPESAARAFRCVGSLMTGHPVARSARARGAGKRVRDQGVRVLWAGWACRRGGGLKCREPTTTQHRRGRAAAPRRAGCAWHGSPPRLHDHRVGSGRQDIARARRDALLTRGDGAAWLAHAPRQANAAVVAARGAALPRARPARRLEEAARRTGAQAGFPFDAGARAVCRLRMLDEG